MGASRRKSDQAFIDEYRRDGGDVRQMGAAQVRVVEQDDVTGLPIETADDSGHGEGHRTEVHRDVRGLRNQFALNGEERA